MKKATQFVGLDVHSESIAVAVADSDGSVRSLGQIPATEDAVRRLIKKLGPARDLRVCYEAGPCGYALYWQLAAMGVACDVIAPTLVPVRSGDRVKTDRRDARAGTPQRRSHGSLGPRQADRGIARHRPRPGGCQERPAAVPASPLQISAASGATVSGNQEVDRKVHGLGEGAAIRERRSASGAR